MGWNGFKLLAIICCFTPSRVVILFKGYFHLDAKIRNDFNVRKLGNNDYFEYFWVNNPFIPVFVVYLQTAWGMKSRVTDALAFIFALNRRDVGNLFWNSSILEAKGKTYGRLFLSTSISYAPRLAWQHSYFVERGSEFPTSAP